MFLKCKSSYLDTKLELFLPEKELNDFSNGRKIGTVRCTNHSEVNLCCILQLYFSPAVLDLHQDHLSMMYGTPGDLDIHQLNRPCNPQKNIAIFQRRTPQ